MDIAKLSMAVSNQSVKNLASIQLMKMTMNTSKETSNSLIDMLNTSIDPNIGNNINTKA